MQQIFRKTYLASGLISTHTRGLAFTVDFQVVLFKGISPLWFDRPLKGSPAANSLISGSISNSLIAFLTKKNFSDPKHKEIGKFEKFSPFPNKIRRASLLRSRGVTSHHGSRKLPKFRFFRRSEDLKVYF